MAAAKKTPGPILGPGNKPVPKADLAKYKAVDAKMTAQLKVSNGQAAKKQKAVKAAVAAAKTPKKPVAKKVK